MPFSMHGLRRLTAAEMEPLVVFMNALMTIFFGCLPLVLLSLPAAVTDKCIELETCLSNLLIPADPDSDVDGRYVVSYETSQQFEILDKFM